MCMMLRLVLVFGIWSGLWAGRAFADEGIKGQVLGGGAPIANATVTLYAASAAAPKQLGQTKTDSDGRFAVSAAGAPAESSLYLTAFGGILANRAVADAEGYYQAFLAAVAGHRVGQRPDRYEPRKIKRRPKPHRLLQRPRQEEKDRFAHGRSH